MNSNVNRRIHSRVIEIKEGFIPFNRSASCKRIRKHDQNLDSSRFSSGRETWNEMNSRTQWGSFSAVNAELLNRELASRWISASNGVHSTKPIKSSPEHGNIDADHFGCRNEFPRPMGFIFAHLQYSDAGMNSRTQWGSLPSATNNRVWQHSADKCTREKRWIPASNGVHSRSATYAAAKSINSQRKSDRESFPLKWPPASNGIHSGAPVEIQCSSSSEGAIDSTIWNQLEWKGLPAWN